jgi:hypothetical protein
MHIIIDRKHKRANFDDQWVDPMGIERARIEKARTIDIPNDSKEPIHRFLREHGLKALLKKKVYCVTDKKDFIVGFIQDIIPPDMIMIYNKGIARFKDVISIGE